MTGTPYESLIKELFFGMQDTVITCLECGKSRRRPEPFLDLMLNVKGSKDVQASFNDQFSFETLDDDNKLTCDDCGKRTSS